MGTALEKSKVAPKAKYSLALSIIQGGKQGRLLNFSDISRLFLRGLVWFWRGPRKETLKRETERVCVRSMLSGGLLGFLQVWAGGKVPEEHDDGKIVDLYAA